MAVLPSCPGLTVEIVVNNRALPEYDDPDETTTQNEVVKFVEARAGQEFQIRYKFNESFPRNNDVGMRLWIDGKHLSNEATTKAYLEPSYTHFCKTLDTKVGTQWVTGTLKFNDIHIVDDLETDARISSLQDLKSVGEIRTTFEFGTMGSKLSKKLKTFSHIEHQKTFPESKLKGGSKSLHIRLGNQAATEVPSNRRFKPNDPGTHFAEFRFKYRTKADLRRLHIIPLGMIALLKRHRGHDNGLNELSEEELSALLEMHQEKGRRSSAIKREEDKSDTTAIRIKQEPGTDETAAVRIKGEPDADGTPAVRIKREPDTDEE